MVVMCYNATPLLAIPSAKQDLSHIIHLCATTD